MKILMQFSVRSVYTYILIIAVHVSAIAQTYNTGNAYISGNVYIKSSFTNASTAVYQNDGNLYIAGNFNNNQPAMAEGSGVTQFIGISQQSLNGNQTPVFHDVVINNTNGVLMNLNTTMGGVISPITGSLFFNGYALTMGGKINTAYTNTSAFNVTPTSDLFITGNASAGNGLYFASVANTIHNVTVSTGATGTLGNALNITPGTAFGTVVVDGSFNAAGLLTIKSDSSGTARIGQSAGAITNYVTVERYIPPRRAWRFMSLPTVNDTMTIRTAWQEGVNNPSLYVRYDPHPGYGTHITGDNNTSAGYDYNTTYNASIKTWVQSTNSWSQYAPSTLYTPINNNEGYCIFVRGSRAVDLALATSAIPDPTVLRTIGRINNNAWNKTYSSIAANDILLVGNPYASSVDIGSLLSASTGIYNNKFYVWDPGLAGSYGVGGYVTYSNGIMAPLTANYPAPTTIIQANQAFLVQSNSTGATVKLKQNDKTASESKIFSLQKPKELPVIYANLLVPSAGNTLVDGVAAGFDTQFSSNADGDDANKLWNFYENIALSRDNKFLSIELRPLPKLSDTLFLKLYIRQQPYTLQLNVKNFESQPVRAWLVDKYLNSKKEINLSGTTLYDFTPNPDTTSYRNRFILVFNHQLATIPVPVSKVNNQSDPNITGVTNSNALEIGSVNIYPNPVKKGEKVLLELNGVKTGDYEAQVFDLTGQKITSKFIHKDEGNNQYSISLPANITTGIYSLRVLKSDGNMIANIKLVIGK